MFNMVLESTSIIWVSIKPYEWCNLEISFLFYCWLYLSLSLPHFFILSSTITPLLLAIDVCLGWVLRYISANSDLLGRRNCYIFGRKHIRFLNNPNTDYIIFKYYANYRCTLLTKGKKITHWIGFGLYILTLPAKLGHRSCTCPTCSKWYEDLYVRFL